PNLVLLDGFMLRHTSRFGWVRPQGAMTAFPWVTGSSNARPFCEFLARHGVVVVPGDCFGYPEHFRLGFGASGERFAAAIDRIESALPQWAPAAATA
ncbi:MAG: aminotransferase class I/II-fold pyridoxal phosphate-dependent enzyme, partial [Bryobacteraceae bacterium]